MYLWESFSKSTFKAQYIEQMKNSNLRGILDKIPHMMIVVCRDEKDVLFTNSHYLQVVQAAEIVFPGITQG